LRCVRPILNTQDAYDDRVTLGAPGDNAIAGIVAASIVVPLVVLVVVGWIFWKASKRDRLAERENRDGA